MHFHRDVDGKAFVVCGGSTCIGTHPRLLKVQSSVHFHDQSPQWTPFGYQYTKDQDQADIITMNAAQLHAPAALLMCRRA